MPHPLWAIAFALVGSAILGTLGLIAGIWADKFDQLAAFQNFLIMPLTFLSGVFYSIHSLPPFWQALSHWNPFFYMIDGFRYGFFGVSDVSPWTSFAIVMVFCVLLSAAALTMLQRGWKLRLCNPSIEETESWSRPNPSSSRSQPAWTATTWRSPATAITGKR